MAFMENSGLVPLAAADPRRKIRCEEGGCVRPAEYLATYVIHERDARRNAERFLCAAHAEALAAGS